MVPYPVSEDELWNLVLDEAEIDTWLEDLGVADLPLDIHVCQPDPEDEAGGENRRKMSVTGLTVAPLSTNYHYYVEFHLQKFVNYLMK